MKFLIPVVVVKKILPGGSGSGGVPDLLANNRVGEDNYHFVAIVMARTCPVSNAVHLF